MTLANDLRTALRPVDPGDGFADRVLARLPAALPRTDADAGRDGGPVPPRLDTPQVAVLPRRVPAAPAATRWAMAASVLLVVAAGYGVHQQRVARQQEAAARELAIALQVTTRELDRVRARLQRTPAETGSWNAPSPSSCCSPSLARASRWLRPRA
jgi:hypothetical protein